MLQSYFAGFEVCYTCTVVFIRYWAIIQDLLKSYFDEIWDKLAVLLCASIAGLQMEFRVTWLAEIRGASLAVVRGWNL